MSKFATPFTIALFLISAVSGTALFFHWSGGLFHRMHEWLSMVLLLPVALHLTLNWRPFVGYLKRGALVLPLIVAVGGAAFLATRRGEGGEEREHERRGAVEQSATADLLTHARIADLAPILGSTPEALQARLSAEGAAVTADDTLSAIAAARHVPEQSLLAEVLPLQSASAEGAEHEEAEEERD